MIQNCRKIIRDCSLATTSCLVTDSFLLLNMTRELRRCRRAARPRPTVTVRFSGLPTCRVQPTELKFNEQIKTGGILGEWQTLERQHPCWDLGIVSYGEKQQIPVHFAVAETWITLSPAFPKTIQLPLSEKAHLNLDDRAFSQISHCPPPVFSVLF